MKIRQRWSRFNRSLAGKPRMFTIAVRMSRSDLLLLRSAARTRRQTMGQFINSLIRDEVLARKAAIDMQRDERLAGEPR